MNQGIHIPKNSAFGKMTEQEFDAVMEKDTFDNFQLTDAVRAVPGFIPREAYRCTAYPDRESDIRIPVIMAAATKDKLMNLFDDCIAEIGSHGDGIVAILETSHDESRSTHRDCVCGDLDSVSLRSMLFDYEDLLLNDGYLGIAVLNENIPLEVQFDEHKLVIIYGQDLKPFERILQQYDLRRNQNTAFISEKEHAHISSKGYAEEFRKLHQRLSGDIYDEDPFDHSLT